MPYWITEESPAPSSRSPKTSYRRFPAVVSGYRYYSPTLARWTSRDPIGEWGGDNIYCFVRNRPTVLIDVLGLLDKLVACDCDEKDIDIKAKEAANLVRKLTVEHPGTYKPPHFVQGIPFFWEYCTLVCCDASKKEAYPVTPRRGHFERSINGVMHWEDIEHPFDPETTPTCGWVFAKKMVKCNNGDKIVRYVHSHGESGTVPSPGDQNFAKDMPLLVVGMNPSDPIIILFKGKWYYYDPKTGERYEVDPATRKRIPMPQ